MIAIHCPKCEANAEVHEQLAGTWHRCTQCKAPIKVPGAGGTTRVLPAGGGGVATIATASTNPFSFDFAGKPKGTTKIVPPLAAHKATTVDVRTPPPEVQVRVQVAPVQEAAVAVPAPVAVTGSRPCPNCSERIPNGEYLCKSCGLDLKTGKKTGVGLNPDTGGELSADALMAARRNAKAVEPISYIKAAFSGAVIGSMLVSAVSAVGAFMLVMLVGFLARTAGGPLIMIPVAILAYGIVIRYPLAMCRSEAAGAEHVSYERWGFIKCGLCFFILQGLFSIAAAVFSHSILIFPLSVLAFIYLPMAWLRVAVFYGEGFYAFNPIEVCKWIGSAIVPYLGVLGLLFLEASLIFGAMVLFMVLVFGAAIYGGISGFQDLGVFSILMAMFMLGLMSLHYTSYMFCMMGMLYRKHGKNMPL